MMDRVIRKPELCELIGLCESTIRLHEIAGTFPRRIKIGPRAVGWRLSAIENWLANREPSIVATTGRDVCERP